MAVERVEDGRNYGGAGHVDILVSTRGDGAGGIDDIGNRQHPAGRQGRIIADVRNTFELREDRCVERVCRQRLGHGSD